MSGVVGTAGVVLVAALLGFWFLASVLNQLPRPKPRWLRKIVAYDIAGLVPVWTFFAPNPGNTDLHLLYRDRLADGRVTPWREVHFGERRHCLSLWNPLRRSSKALVDLSSSLTAYDAPPGGRPMPRRLVLSFPYLLVLNYVSTLRHDFAATGVQFALARTTGYRGRSGPGVFLVSAIHALEDDGLGREEPALAAPAAEPQAVAS
ncbi:MAG TPA: hypothetical protein VF587_12860 [Solirubrobacteraceae bacterium]|jgi:hypothetical protein